MSERIITRLSKCENNVTNINTKKVEYTKVNTPVSDSCAYTMIQNVIKSNTIEEIENSDLLNYINHYGKKCIIFADDSIDLHLFPPEETLLIGDFTYNDIEIASKFPHQKQIAFFYDAPLIHIAASFKKPMMQEYARINNIQNNSQSVEELKQLLQSIYSSIENEQPIDMMDINSEFTKSFVEDFEKYNFIIFYFHRYSMIEIEQTMSLLLDRRIHDNINEFNMIYTENSPKLVQFISESINLFDI